MAAIRVLEIGVDTYECHRLHHSEMPWQETNCYLDIWIELIHAFGFEVEPMLGFTLGADFEHDQWTFSKPSFHFLERLYGFRTEELVLWRHLPEQCATQVMHGRILLLEVDSYFLPDTVATDYRRNHVKTTIGINFIDLESRQLGYFHNAGYHALNGEDYDGLFHLNRRHSSDYLPPYCEIVKTGYLRQSDPGPELVLQQLRHELERKAKSNPFKRYAEIFDSHLRWITDMESYHAYAFVTLRQCGAAFDLASKHLLWINSTKAVSNDDAWYEAATQFAEISTLCKALLLKLARVANGKAAQSFTPMLARMAQAWFMGMERTEAAVAAAE